MLRKRSAAFFGSTERYRRYSKTILLSRLTTCDISRALQLKATNEHQGSAQEVYEGVSLATLLKQAGAPQGAQIKGAALATYIVAEGSDGYRVVLSLAEVDSDFQDSEIIVADTHERSASCAIKLDRLRLVVPHDQATGPHGSECFSQSK